MAKNSAGSVSVDLTLNNKQYNNQLNSSLKGTETSFSNTFKKVAGLVAGAFTVKAITNFTKSCIDSASKVQSAFTGLNSIVSGTGNSFSQAQKFVEEYTKDGLISIEETATAYKNLLARGYDTSQIEDVMTRLKDSAAFGRQASYDLGEAVVSATEGLKNENSILVDNAGVTKNVAKMWEEWAKAHNTTTSAMTQAQKIEAEYNGIMQETRFQVGDATAYTKTFGGQIQQLKFNFNQMTVAIGKVVAPIAQLFIPIINSAISAVTNFFTKIQELLKVFGLEMPDVVSKASSSIGGVGSNAQSTAGDISSTGTAAKKAAKEINKAFSNVDEINILNTKKDANSSSSGESGSSNTVSPSIDNSSVTESNNAFSQLIERVKQLKNLFIEGFDFSFDVDFKSIGDHITNIGTQLKSIFTDPDVQNAGNNFANRFIYNLGVISGSIGTVAGNIVETFVGSIDTYLSQNSERIKTSITNIFNINSDRLDWYGIVSKKFAELSSIFTSDTAKQIGANIISTFANPFMSLAETFSSFAGDTEKLLTKPFVENMDGIKKSVEKTLKPIEKLTGTLSNAFTHIGDSINNTYNTYIAPFLDKLGTGISDTFGKFIEVYNTYIAPFIDSLVARISETWNNYLKPLWDNLMAFIGSIVELLSGLYENYLKPIIDWAIENIIPVIIPIIDQISNAVSFVFNIISNTISGIIGVLTGIITYITGIFTGDWSKCWDGIKKIFSSIWDGIKGVINAVINFISDTITNGFNYINNFISGILNTIFGVIQSVFNKIKTTISNIWNGIKTVITTVITFIKNGISNGFESVKNGIKKVMDTISTTISNIWNGIWDTIKGIINKIISGVENLVNTVIKGLNKIITPLTEVGNTILEAVGIDNFKFNPLKEVKLPRLAQGGWFEANDPQLTIVGDNTREAEIVAPESKIYDQVLKAIKDSKSNGKQEFEITIKIVSEDGRTMIKKINQAELEAGEILLLV